MLKIFLSAILFNLAFYYPDKIGFFIIISFFYVFLTLNKIKNFLFCLKAGFLWGLIVFSVHFIWLFILLITKSNANLFLSILIYVFMVLYSTFFSILWFIINNLFFKFFYNKFLRIIFYFISIFSLFVFFDRYFLFFLNDLKGYPFLNPLISLVNYKLFVFIYSFLCLNLGINCFNKSDINYLINNYKIFYLKPIKNYKNNPIILGQKIYYELAKLNLKKIKNDKIIIVAPETFFPFCLNKYPKIINLWNCVLSDSVNFFLGSQRLDKNKIYQSVYWLKRDRIINFYDKKHSFPFSEKIPNLYQKYKWIQDLFLKETDPFYIGNENKTFNIDHKLNIIPRICSDFFYFKKNHFLYKKLQNEILFLFVNDSWFLGYFKKILYNFVCLKSIELNINIFYITHNNYYII